MNRSGGANTVCRRIDDNAIQYSANQVTLASSVISVAAKTLSFNFRCREGNLINNIFNGIVLERMKIL